MRFADAPHPPPFAETIARENPMTTFDTAIRSEAERVRCELAAQNEAWRTHGWTRRRFLSGLGLVGVAALGSQLVTTRAAYAATPTGTENTVVVVFLRGAADGLRMLVPKTSLLGGDYLATVRGALVPPDSALQALTGGWALNSALQPLYDQLWSGGQLAFVPAVSTAGISRSHFQAQQYLERGGTDSATTGWLERVLELLGPGTTFRVVAEGSTAPMSLAGGSSTLALRSVDELVFPGWDGIVQTSRTAVSQLYRSVDGFLAEDVPTALAAIDTAATVRAAKAASPTYPAGNFGAALADLAAILRAEVGLQVATVDVGGWDTHTDEANQLDNVLGSFAAALKTFFDDLGPTRRQRVTVVCMTEFGRRVALNASGGTDHGHGSLMMLLGGGLAGSGVYGKWNALSAATLDNGDVPGLNNPFDVLGEIVQKRLGAGSLSTVFPGYTPTPLGLATTL